MLAGLRKRLFSQFGAPRGLLGHVAGRAMARGNRAVNAWVVELLDVGPEDRVLDVGCGPGIAVELCTGHATQGRVVGVDRSRVMVAQASRRNAAAIAARRAEVREAPAEALPFPEAAFTRALSVNSMAHWEDARGGIAELTRVLAHGGRLVLALRMRNPSAGAWDRTAYGATEERVAAVAASLGDAGFRDVETVTRVVGGERHSALIARR